MEELCQVEQERERAFKTDTLYVYACCSYYTYTSYMHLRSRLSCSSWSWCWFFSKWIWLRNSTMTAWSATPAIHISSKRDIFLTSRQQKLKLYKHPSIYKFVFFFLIYWIYNLGRDVFCYYLAWISMTRKRTTTRTWWRRLLNTGSTNPCGGRPKSKKKHQQST